MGCQAERKGERGGVGKTLAARTNGQKKELGPCDRASFALVGT